MLVKQLSVFLENKKGRLTDLTKAIGANDINLVALSIAESSEFGIIRLIVSEPEKAMETLKAEKFAVTMNEVICLQCPNKAGALYRVLDILSKNDIFTEYMYAFSMGDASNLIIRPDKLDKCVEVLQKNKLMLIAADDLYKF